MAIAYYKGTLVGLWNERPDDEYNSYTVAIELDDESVRAYKSNGGQGKIGEANLVFFRSPEEKELIRKKDGEPFTIGGPIKIVHGPEGEEVPMENGNRAGKGSEVIIRVSHYQSRGGTGTRAEALKILEFVEREDNDRPF